MARNLFVYGVLTFPEIVFSLTGRNFKSEPATIRNAIVRRVEDKPYPGLLRSNGKISNGAVLFDVDDESYEIIKKWEDNGYITIEEYVETVKGAIKATIFVFTTPKLLGGDWDRNLFRKQHLNNYLNTKIPDFLKSIR